MEEINNLQEKVNETEISSNKGTVPSPDQPIRGKDQESHLDTENKKPNENEVKEESLSKDDLSVFISLINTLKVDLTLRSERDNYKDEAIHRMTKQVEQYEKGMIKKIKEPIIRDLILLSDSIEKLCRKFRDIENTGLNNELGLLQDEVEEILYTNSVEKINLNDFIEYDKDNQKVVRKIATDNKENDKKIVEVTKSGYLWGNEVIRKQEIVVYEYIENKNDN